MHVSLEPEFLRNELPRGPIPIGPAPALASVGTIAEIALANPLLREPLARAGFAPRVYLPFATPDDMLASNEWQLGLVISPFKQSVARYCSSVSPTARATGVVDTLIRAEGDLVGVNTNAYAAGETLRSFLCAGVVERVLLIGTGASARSVAYAISRWYPNLQLGIYGRSVTRATTLAETLGATPVATPASFEAQAIVHATTVGEVDDSVTLGPVVDAALAPGVRVFDLTNRLAALQVQALASGCLVVSGMLMQRITNHLRVAAVAL